LNIYFQARKNILLEQDSFCLNLNFPFAGIRATAAEQLGLLIQDQIKSWRLYNIIKLSPLAILLYVRCQGFHGLAKDFFSLTQF
jgi:hypothetical protein